MDYQQTTVSPFEDEKARVEELVACRGPGLPRFRARSDRARATKAQVEWTQDLGDPELKKSLRILHALIDGAQGICERERSGEPSATVRSDRERLITSRLEFATRVGLPRGRPLTLEALLEHRFEVEQLLIELGDRPYVETRTGAVYDEREGTHVRWRDMFGDDLPPVLAATTDESLEATRHMLQRLMAAKVSQDHPIRARRELKRGALRVVLPVLLVATSLFALALGIIEDEVKMVLLVGTAGLSGAAVGGLLQLRDEVNRGAQLREFVPFYLGQLLLGITAGLVAFAVDQSGIVDVGGESAGVAARLRSGLL